MTYSLGEVDALCRKAARGAGFSWGMAEEAGRAVRWLSAWGLPGAQALAGYLAEPRASPPKDPGQAEWSAVGRLCPIICGALISDLGPCGRELRLSQVAWPLLLLPQIGEGHRLSWGKTSLTILRGVHVQGEPMCKMANVSLAPAATSMGELCVQTTRVSLQSEDLTALNAFAQRTYAPETEKSQRLGAGAGPKDAD